MTHAPILAYCDDIKLTVCRFTMQIMQILLKFCSNIGLKGTGTSSKFTLFKPYTEVCSMVISYSILSFQALSERYVFMLIFMLVFMSTTAMLLLISFWYILGSIVVNITVFYMDAFPYFK